MKKLFAIGIIAGALFLTGCGNKTPNVTPEENVTVEENTDTTKKNATKDQCLELMAYAMKVATFQAQGDTAAATKWAQKANDLEIVYKGDTIEYEETCGKFLATDASFMAAVQKMMADLK